MAGSDEVDLIKENLPMKFSLLPIDNQTAAVFVEFTLFNPNINMYQYCSVVFEKLISGGFVNTAQFVPLDLVNSEFLSSKIILL